MSEQLPENPSQDHPEPPEEPQDEVVLSPEEPLELEGEAAVLSDVPDDPATNAAVREQLLDESKDQDVESLKGEQREMPVPDPGEIVVATSPPQLRIEMPRNLRVLIRLLVLLLALASIGAHGLLAWMHLDDRYGIDPAAGTLIALSDYATQGQLYPPIYDEETGLYGGTVFMPVGILMRAFAAKLTGEPLISAKLLSATTMTLLCFLMLVALLRLRCALITSLGLIGAMLMTATALSATTSVRGDTLPVILQLFAVMLFAARNGNGIPMSAARVFFAALLCALAFFCKLSAVWAPLAIGGWLLVNHPRRFMAFAAYLFAFVVVGAAGFHLLTDGRISENVFTFAFSGVNGLESLMYAPARGLTLLRDHAPACWVLIPLAGLAIMLAMVRGKTHVLHLSLFAALPVLLVTLGDPVSGGNHLLDFLVLISLCAGGLWPVAGQGIRKMGYTQAAMGILLLWSMASGLVVHARTDLYETFTALLDQKPLEQFDPIPLEDVIPLGAVILSEDPYLPVSRGAHPVVLDPQMLLRIGRRQPELLETLFARIEAREFDAIVLLRRVELDVPRYEQECFGRGFAEALEANYQFRLEQEGYVIYEPKSGEGEDPLSEPGGLISLGADKAP